MNFSRNKSKHLELIKENIHCREHNEFLQSRNCLNCNSIINEKLRDYTLFAFTWNVHQTDPPSSHLAKSGLLNALGEYKKRDQCK